MALDIITEPVLKDWMHDYSFILIQSIEHLKEVIDKAIKSGFCSFDLESTGLDTRVFNGVCKSYVVGYSISFEDKIGYYIPIRHKMEVDKGCNLPPEQVNPLIQKLLLECEIVGQNWLKYDAEILYASEGIVIQKEIPGKKYPYEDTYVLARLAGFLNSGLKAMSRDLLGKEMLELRDVVYDDDDGTKNYDFSSISPYEGLHYAASDAICTREVYLNEKLQTVKTEQKIVYGIEVKLLKCVRKLERNKVKLNLDFCNQLDKQLRDSIDFLEKSIYQMVNEKTNGDIKKFQLDSPEEVSKILFEIFDMNPKPEKAKKGFYLTNDDVLETLVGKYPLAKKIQDYRTDTKFHRTYIKNMLFNVDADGYLKFNFAPLKTDSGRFASPGREKEGLGKDGYSGVNIQCVGGETKILIKNLGFVKIEEVPNREVDIWDGNSFVKAHCVSSGKKQKVIIHFHNGQEFICSPDHRFLTKSETGKETVWKTCREFNKREGIVLSLEPSDFDNNLNFDVPLNVQNVKKIEITDEYIEMYDIVGCPNERFAADGFIVHNSTPARYDASKPNVRKCFSCEDDEVIAALDWSGVELRVAANLSKEPIWLERFISGDGDLHTSTASIIYGIPESKVDKEQRQMGKCVDVNSLFFINGEYRRIGSLHKSREKDVFYNIENENLSVSISDTEFSKIKNFYSNGISKRYLVCFRRGLLVCSENHRLELEDGTLVKAKDIKEEMILKDVGYGIQSNKLTSLIEEDFAIDFKEMSKVPDNILNSDFFSKLKFLAKVIDDYGDISTSGDISLKHNSWILVQDLGILLASCSIFYIISVNYIETNLTYSFKIDIDPFSNKKVIPFLENIYKKNKIRITEDNFFNLFENKITKVISLPDDYLVDIEIEHPEHIYLVNNIRTHNTFNFQTVYGGGPGALATALNTTMDDAREKQQKYFGKLKGLNKWIKDTQNKALKEHYCTTAFGRKRLLPEMASDIPKIISSGKRKAINSPIQGTSGDLLKLAMIEIDRYLETNNLEDKVQMLITMHDELVFRIKKSHVGVVHKLSEIMKLEKYLKSLKWEVPLQIDCEIGSSWDVDYQIDDMLEFIKEKKGWSVLEDIYKPEVDYPALLKDYKNFLKEKKEKKIAKEQQSKENTSEIKDDFKLHGNAVKDKESPSDTLLLKEKLPEKIVIKEEVISSENKPASAEDIEEAFKIISEISLGDLPPEAYLKLKTSFYKREAERLLSGAPSEDDRDVEFPIIVHSPLDSAKKITLGYIIDSCPGNAKIQFLTENREELHEGLLELDVLKVVIMAKVLNL